MCQPRLHLSQMTHNELYEFYTGELRLTEKNAEANRMGRGAAAALESANGRCVSLLHKVAHGAACSSVSGTTHPCCRCLKSKHTPIYRHQSSYRTAYQIIVSSPYPVFSVLLPLNYVLHFIVSFIHLLVANGTN